ncbi:unnamed protein product, partial [Nesidiocoris tenuis]
MKYIIKITNIVQYFYAKEGVRRRKQFGNIRPVRPFIAKGLLNIQSSGINYRS